MIKTEKLESSSAADAGGLDFFEINFFNFSIIII
jgi:hypothetical protein